MANKPVTTSHKAVTRHAARKPSDFGTNLSRARRRLLWTRARLASRAKDANQCGVHENTIYNIEKGYTQPSLEAQHILTEAITAALGCDYPWEDNAKLLNKTSLAGLITASHLAARIDHAIAFANKLEVLPPESFIDPLLARASYVGLKDPAEIEGLLKENEQLVTAFGTLCYKNGIARSPFVPRGLCIAALEAILVLQKNDPANLLEFVRKYGLDRKANPRERAKAIHRTYQQAKQALKLK